MSTESTNPVCPDCGAALPPDAVLCVACGLNLKTGQKMPSQLGTKAKPNTPPPTQEKKAAKKTAAPASRTAMFATLAAIVVVLGLAGGFFVLQQRKSGGGSAGGGTAAGGGDGGAALNPQAAQQAAAWQAERATARETTLCQGGPANVKGPRFAAVPFAERIGTNPLLPILIESVRGKQPAQPVQVTLSLVDPAAAVPETVPGAIPAAIPGTVPGLGSTPGRVVLRLEISYGEPGKKLLERDFTGEATGLGVSVPGVPADDLARAEAEDLAAAAAAQAVPALLAGAAAALPRPAPALLDEMEKWLADTAAPEKQQAACLFFAGRPVRAKRTLPLLTPLLAPAYPSEVRRSALGAIGALGAESAGLLPVLTTLLEDPDPRIQSGARLAIAGIKTAQMGAELVHPDPPPDPTAARREAAAREAEKKREEKAIASLLEEFEKASRPRR
jgi:ribosomal protein L40E